jgi:hypothetical protein
MYVNSLGDWVVYGCGLMVLISGTAKLLPDVVVSCTLTTYRSYRKLCAGLEQVRRELPLEKDVAKYLPAQ